MCDASELLGSPDYPIFLCVFANAIPSAQMSFLSKKASSLSSNNVLSPLDAPLISPDEHSFLHLACRYPPLSLHHITLELRISLLAS